MPNTTQGSVASPWRYPAKSMLGEELSGTKVTGVHYSPSAAAWPRAKLPIGIDQAEAVIANIEIFAA